VTTAGGWKAVLIGAAVLSAALGLSATGAAASPRPAASQPVASQRASAGPVGPSSTYNVLTSVSADSASDAWAVGYYISKSVRYALILQWNGTAWSVR
jgi:hypothetical protein